MTSSKFKQTLYKSQGGQTLTQLDNISKKIQIFSVPETDRLVGPQTNRSNQFNSLPKNKRPLRTNL